MRKIIKHLTKSKDYTIGLLSNHQNKLGIMAVIFITAFFISSLRNVNHATEEMILLKKNSDLLIENHQLKFMLHKQGIIINQQLLRIDELERLKRALLNGHYTEFKKQHHENKSVEQTNVQVVQR